MLVTVLSLFLMSHPAQVKDEMRFGHPGQSRLQKRRPLLANHGHLFAGDEGLDGSLPLVDCRKGGL